MFDLKYIFFYMKRKATSIKIDPEIWKKAKKLAIDRGITFSELLEDALKKELEEK